MVTTKDTMVHPAERRWIVGIVIASLLILILVMVDLATGGRVDPPALRAQATLLDGPWRFRIGDDPHWAETTTNDSYWETIDLTAPPGSHDGDVGLPDYVGGWMAHGHPGYNGYAWYRRAVMVPPGQATWDVLGPTLVDHAYELYWNGRLLGGSGRLGPTPHIVGTRPMRFSLPADAAGTRGILAVRVLMLRSPPSADGGGMHSAPILASRAVAEGLQRAHWARTIAGYIADAVEPLMMFVVIGLALAFRSPGNGYDSFLIFASIALAFMGERRLNNAIVAWTDLQDLKTYSWLATWMWVPAVTAWLLAWNGWPARLRRSLDLANGVVTVVAFISIALHSAALTRISRLAFIALFVVIAVRIARGGSMRILALATLTSIVLGLFGGEILDPLGVPGIWFPFGIGVSRTQYIYAIMIPLIAVLIVRTRFSVPRAGSYLD